MRNYQNLFLSSIKEKLQMWTEADAGLIGPAELRFFLRYAAQTAGTIGLPDMAAHAGSLLLGVDSAPGKLWLPLELRRYLEGLETAVNKELESKKPILGSGMGDSHAAAPSGLPVIVAWSGDALFLAELKHELESRGYGILAVSRPERVIEYAHQFDPAAMVVELDMQGKSGFDWVLSVQNEIGRPWLPTTVISSQDSKEIRLEAYRSGVDDFLVKPIDWEELCARLSRQLARKAMRQPNLSSLESTAATVADHQKRSGSTRIRAAIVDDDPVVTTMLQEYLQASFAQQISEIRTYTDGEQFMNDSWSGEPVPCLVVLDRMMPRMDGMEVLFRIRQSAYSRFYQILMLTSKKSESDVVKALELGADDYVTKPFSLKELEARMKRLAARMG